MEMANTTDLQQETSPTTETTITYDGCSETVDCPQCGDVWDQAEILRDDRTVGPLGCCGWRGTWDYSVLSAPPHHRAYTYAYHSGDTDYYHYTCSRGHQMRGAVPEGTDIAECPECVADTTRDDDGGDA